MGAFGGTTEPLAGWRFGSTLRKRRLELRLPLRVVAEASSSWIGSIAGYETGRILPRSPLVIEALAKVLSLDAAELAGLVALDRRVRKAQAARYRRSPKVQFTDLIAAVKRIADAVERLARDRDEGAPQCSE